VAKWWIPERWALILEVPKTGVGKFDRKTLRALHGCGQIEEIVLSEIRAGRESPSEELVP